MQFVKNFLANNPDVEELNLSGCTQLEEVRRGSDGLSLKMNDITDSDP